MFVYHEDTPKDVRQVLERARSKDFRIRVVYGDAETGKSWGEEHYVEGYVGRSTGTKKIPLLVYNTRSYGGPGILDHCIVRILTTHGQVLYEHPTYRPAHDWKSMVITAVDANVIRVGVPDESWIAGFETVLKAENWLKKIQKYELKESE